HDRRHGHPRPRLRRPLPLRLRARPPRARRQPRPLPARRLSRRPRGHPRLPRLRRAAARRRPPPLPPPAQAVRFGVTRVDVASVVGDPDHHPNEDAWSADPSHGIFVICDGVTSSHLPDGTYPTWAGGARAAWLAAAAIAATAPTLGLTDALAAA